MVLNVKQVHLRSFSDHRVSMHLEVYGQREVTDPDLVISLVVEIINSGLHLATLTDEEAHLSMEWVVENGKGYVFADSQDDMPEGVIPVDAMQQMEEVGAYRVVSRDSTFLSMCEENLQSSQFSYTFYGRIQQTWDKTASSVDPMFVDEVWRQETYPEPADHIEKRSSGRKVSLF